MGNTAASLKSTFANAAAAARSEAEEIFPNWRESVVIGANWGVLVGAMTWVMTSGANLAGINANSGLIQGIIVLAASVVTKVIEPAGRLSNYDPKDVAEMTRLAGIYGVPVLALYEIMRVINSGLASDVKQMAIAAVLVVATNYSRVATHLTRSVQREVGSQGGGEPSADLKALQDKIARLEWDLKDKSAMLEQAQETISDQDILLEAAGVAPRLSDEESALIDAVTSLDFPDDGPVAKSNTLSGLGSQIFRGKTGGGGGIVQ